MKEYKGRMKGKMSETFETIEDAIAHGEWALNLEPGTKVLCSWVPTNFKGDRGKNNWFIVEFERSWTSPRCNSKVMVSLKTSAGTPFTLEPIDSGWIKPYNKKPLTLKSLSSAQASRLASDYFQRLRYAGVSKLTPKEKAIYDGLYYWAEAVVSGCRYGNDPRNLEARNEAYKYLRIAEQNEETVNEWLQENQELT